MSNRGLGSLTLSLITKIAGFTAPLSQAERQMDKSARAMQRRAQELQRGITGAFKSVGAGLAGFAAGFVSVQAVFDGIKNAIDQADKLNDFNQRLGISAEALSGWGYAATQAGTDIDALGIGLKKLAKNMAEALDPKSEQAGIFKALGVGVKDAQGNLRDLEQVLPEIASAFKALNNETLEAALAQQIFGKSGTDLIEFLNLGSDGLDTMRERARELGIELDQNTLQAADAFNDQLADLRAASQGFFTQLSAELLPTLTKLVAQLTEVVSDGSAAERTADGLARAFEFVSRMAGVAYARLDGIGKILEGLTEGFRGLTGAANAVFSGNFALAAQIFKDNTGDQFIRQGVAQLVTGVRPPSGKPAATRKQPTVIGKDFQNVLSGDAAKRAARAAEIERRLNELLSGEGKDKAKKTGGAKKTGKSDAEREAEQLQKAYERLSGGLNEQIATFGQVSEAAKLRYELEHGELSKLSEAKKLELITNQELLDVLNATVEVDEELARVAKDGEERAKQLQADALFEIELLGKTREEQELLTAARYLGAAAATEQGQAALKALEQQQEAAKQVNEQIDGMDALRDSTRGFLDDLREGVSIWDALDNALKKYADRLFDLAADKLIDQLFGKVGTTQTGSLGGVFSSASASGGASGGGFWNSLLSAFGSLFGGGRATGGPVASGKFYRVNEHRPELLSWGGDDYLMMGANSGMVRPGIGGGLQQTFIVQGTPTRQTAEQMARSAGREARRGMARTGAG